MELLSICGVWVSIPNLLTLQDTNDFFAGCILAELYTGYPLFPGENEVEQLACLMEVLGAPPDDLISAATRKRLFFGKHHSESFN